MFELSKIKPIVAVSDAVMASAAYWIGSAANAVFISGRTVNVGSIGVVATHRYSAEAPTSKTTEITAGKYKRMGSALEPLNDEARAYMQAQVDQIYSVFVDAVAQHRGVSADQVIEHMADGRIFVGQQAIDAGLVDGVATVDAIAEQLKADPGRFTRRRKASFAPSASATQTQAIDDAQVPPVDGDPSTEPSSTTTGDAMSTTAPLTAAAVLALVTREQLQAHAPALFASLQTEFTQAGASAERDRIVGVRAAGLPGHEKLIETLAMDGKTTPAEAALQVLGAERAVRAGAAQAHAADAPPAVPNGGEQRSDAGAKSKDAQVAEAQAYAKKEGVSLGRRLQGPRLRRLIGRQFSQPTGDPHHEHRHPHPDGHRRSRPDPEPGGHHPRRRACGRCRRAGHLAQQRSQRPAGAR